MSTRSENTVTINQPIEKVHQALLTQGYWEHIVATQDWHIDPKGHFSEDPDFVDTWPVHCVADTEGAAMS